MDRKELHGWMEHSASGSVDAITGTVERGMIMEYICDHCKKQVNCKMQPSRDLEFDCGMYERRKSPTNAERIRAMSDEELAEFIENAESAGYRDSSITPKLENGYHMDLLKWLKSPAEEGEANAKEK